MRSTNFSIQPIFHFYPNSYASNPVSAPDAFLTFPAYGFQTLAVGTTREITENWEISLSFERAFPISVKTRTSTIDDFHANSQEDHNQYSAQLQLGWSFERSEEGDFQ